MKKMTNIGVIGLLVAALFFGGTGASQAASNTGSNTSTAAEVVIGTNMPYSSGLSAELEAALKAANIRCATLATSERKAACVKENEAAIRVKAEAMYKQLPATDAKRIEFRGEPIGGGVKGGNVGSSEKDVRVDAKGDVKPAPAPMGQGQNNEGVDFAKRFEGVIARLVAYVDRFATLKTRIETRTSDLSAKGVDVAQAKTSLVNGQKYLDSAKTAIEAARVSFKEEFASKGMDYAVEDSTKSDEKTVFSMAKFKVCADTVKAIQMTAPERCVMNGMTYVNSDQKMVPAAETDSSVKPAPAPGIRGAMGLGKFTKTKEHIKSAGQFLIQAQYEFLSANSFLTQAEANLK